MKRNTLILRASRRSSFSLSNADWYGTNRWASPCPAWCVQGCGVTRRGARRGVLTPAVSCLSDSNLQRLAASPPALSSPLCLRSAPAQGQYKQHYLCLAKHPLITHERAHAPDAPRHPPTAIKHSLKACYLILAHLSLSEDILKINKSASDLHMHSSWYLYSAGASPKGLSYYLCPRVLARRPGRQAGD